MKFAHAVSAFVVLASPYVAMAAEELPNLAADPATADAPKPSLAEQEAADTRPPVWSKNLKLVLGGGITSGGTTLFTVPDGSGENVDIKAGQLIDFHAGIEYRWDLYAVQATYGIHFDPISDGDFEINFERFPIELLGYYKLNDRFRVGGGIRYAKDARITGSGDASAFGVTQLDSHPGAVMEIEYRASPHLGWKARYVVETYELHGFEKTGSHVGLFLNTYW